MAASRCFVPPSADLAEIPPHGAAEHAPPCLWLNLGRIALQKMQDPKRKSLMDAYEYVMYGKIFKYKDSSKSGQLRVEVFISFGGLLMQLIGDPKKLETLEVDNNVYLLLRKV